MIEKPVSLRSHQIQSFRMHVRELPFMGVNFFSGPLLMKEDASVHELLMREGL